MSDNIVVPQPEEQYHRESSDLSVTVPEDRRLFIESPGWMNYAQPGGGYPGCRVCSIHSVNNRLVISGLDPKDAAKFVEQLAEARADSPAEAFNLYFMHRANLLLTFMSAYSDGITFAFTNNLEGERLERFQEASRRIAREMDEWEQAQQERKAKEFAEAEAKGKELERLAELGRKAEKENVFEAFRRLSKQRKSMKAELFKLGGKEAVNAAGLGDDDE